MKTLLAIFPLFLVAVNDSRATAQVADLLVIQGRRIYSRDTPMLSEAFWDENILRGQVFPLKVESWSGAVKQSSSGSSFDPNTGKTERYDKVTTIAFEKGKVTKVDFDKKVLRKNDPNKKSK